MCGIAGIVSAASANKQSVDAMTAVLAHRGPDGEGSWTSVDGHCVLGHRRLAIIDLSEGGRQPLIWRDGQLAITYNGEIYNFIELRQRLKALGHDFHTESDTEVLLHAYLEWGTACLEHFNGMFAFALWDEQRKVLFCARDRFGEKPFVYAKLNKDFAFASEVKALALLKGVDLSIDEGVLAACAEGGLNRADASERTLVNGVRQLLPAHAMEVSCAGGTPALRTWRYWSVDVEGRRPYGTLEGEDAARELLELLTDSVRLRLRSDVPVGSCLSGGLDSSTVVSLVRRLEPNSDVRTFTGCFPDDPAVDEWKYAQLVIQASRTDSHRVDPTPERFASEAARLYWHADFPIGGTSQFAQWCVFHLASTNGVTVLLDGQGSDELLGGYGNDIVNAFLAQLGAEHRLVAWMRERHAWSRVSPASFSWSKLPLEWPLIRSIRPLLRRATNRSVLSECDLFQAEWLRTAQLDRPPLDGEERTEDQGLSACLWTLSFRTMLSSLLRFGDRLSMAHSREVRLPFCDHRIAEFAFSLPPELLVGNGTVKRVLRLAIRGVVPDEIVGRRKQGFVPPQTRWLLGPLRDWIVDLTDDAAALSPYLNVERVRALGRSEESVRRREINLLWTAVNLLAWERYALSRMRSSSRYEPSLAYTVAAPSSAGIV